MNKDKVAIIDTNFSSSPIYEYLVKLHFDVFVIGNNQVILIKFHLTM